MSMIQYTPKDYCTYLQMSARPHVLIGSRHERGVFESTPDLLFAESSQFDFDVIEDLVFFEEPLNRQDKIDQLHNCANDAEISSSLIVIDNLDFFLFKNSEELPNITVSNDDIRQSVNEALTWMTASGVLISNVEYVRNYLLQHHDTLDALVSITNVVIENFQSDSQLSLEVYEDPEDEDRYLSFYIRQENYDEHIVERLDAMRLIYNQFLAGRSGWVIVTTDFDAPR